MADLSEARLAGLPSARTIHFRIASLVLLILAPLLAAFCWMAFHLAASKRELIEAERAAITAAVTSDIDRHVSTTFGLLTGLATSDDLVTGNFAEFERQARAMADRADIVRVWAFDPGGQTVAGMGKPANAESAEGLEPETITRTFRGERTVSRVHGSGPEEATVFMAVPVRGGSTVLYGIAAEVLIGGMGRTFTKAGMPDPWVAAIVDGNGRFIARSLDADRRLGKIARPELVRVAAAPSEKGVFENVTYEGLHTLNSYRRSPLTGWTTVVAVPKAIVEAPLHRSIYLMLIGGAIALLSTLGAAYLYATRISEPVLNLGRIASALAKGAPYVPTRHPLVELEEVQRAFEAAIAESAHLAALVNSSGDAIMSMDLDGRIRTWNPAAEQLFGYTAEEIIGRPKATLVPPEALDEHLSIQAEVASGNNRRTETVRQNRNGMRISVSLDAAPIRRPDGMIIGISSILHDITERIADEEHRHFLMREIAHRSKNQLAIIQSIANQTARGSGSTAEFLARFRGRLQGLSASHDLLLRQDWHGALLDELIRSQIEAFVGPSSSAVSVSGPPAMLSAAAAEAIGLAIHELATNAAKYGALSVPSGTVHIGWRLLPGEPEPRWELTWRETGGPPVEEPDSNGFGTQVIKRMTAVAVGGKADVDYRPTGLVWKLVFPASVTRPQPVSTGRPARRPRDAASATTKVGSSTRP